MSPSRTPTSTAKRVPYKPPRDRHELWVAIAVGVTIVVVTGALLWFLRPNRESAASPSPVATTPATTAPVSPTTTVPTETTVAPEATGDTTADPGTPTP
jgi:hypothetical protein